MDDLLVHQYQDFENSALYNKIKDFIYQPIAQPDTTDRKTWFLANPQRIYLKNNKILNEIFKEDFRHICSILKIELENRGNIHTTNGRYLQIRTKDSKSKGKYHPVFYKHQNRYVSDKNYAFYFKRKFLEDILTDKFKE